MPFVKLENLLDKTVRKAGIKKQLEDNKILEEFQEIVAEIFGGNVLNKIKPLYVSDGVLNIACLSSVLAEEIKFKEGEILAELNKPYKRKIVRQLRFLV